MKIVPSEWIDKKQNDDNEKINDNDDETETFKWVNINSVIWGEKPAHDRDNMKMKATEQGRKLKIRQRTYLPNSSQCPCKKGTEESNKTLKYI